MQIIIPMAGKGQRFLDAGYTEPKPLIKVDGKPMIEHVVDLFRRGKDQSKFIFIYNEDHSENSGLEDFLRNLKVKKIMAKIKSHKLGPVYSVLEAFQYISEEEPAIMTYCDFNMYWDEEEFEKLVDKLHPDGAIFCYTGFHPHLYGPNKYAGVKTDEQNIVLEIREKHSYTEDKMQSWHSNGTYYFKDGSVIKKYFKNLVNQKLVHDNGEYYVSQIYNPMIKDGCKIILYPISHFCQWGTPEDLEQYQAWQNGLTLKQLVERFPHIPEEGHKRALEYWSEFRKKSI